MDRLWAPWRIKYVGAKRHKGCVFCRAAKAGTREQVVFRTKYSLCMLNIFPYNNGHLMVCPIRHIKEPSRLTETEIVDLFRAFTRAQALLGKVVRPEGYNVGINISRSGGAGITGHLHIHIVPRWHGDTNFMPVVAGTKVISQSLEELHKRLRDADAKTDH